MDTPLIWSYVFTLNILTSASYYTHPKISISLFLLPFNVTTVGQVVISVDPNLGLPWIYTVCSGLSVRILRDLMWYFSVYVVCKVTKHPYAVYMQLEKA